MNGDPLANHEHTQQHAITKGVSIRAGIKGISLPVFATYVTAVIKYLTKATKGGKIGLGSQWEGSVHPDRESTAAEAEATAHIASMVKKNTGAPLPFSLYSVQDSTPWNGATQT